MTLSLIFKIERDGEYSVGVFSIPDFREIIKEKMSELVYCNFSDENSHFNTEYQHTSRLSFFKDLVYKYSDQASGGASGEIVRSILELIFSKESLEDSLDEFVINISSFNILACNNQFFRRQGSYFYNKCIMIMNGGGRNSFLRHIDVPFDRSLKGQDIMEILDKQFLYHDQTHEGLRNFFMNFKDIESLLTDLNLYEDSGVDYVADIVARTARNMYYEANNNPNHSHYFSKYDSSRLDRDIFSWKDNLDSKRIIKKAIRQTLKYLNIPRSKW